MYKIEAVVKFNTGEALVLNKNPKITYERYDNYLLGLDEYGIFCNCYSYDKPGKNWRAFAGRKFEIPMADGSSIEAFGQWWDGGVRKFIEVVGCDIISVTCNSIIDLKNCYVFTGYRAIKDEYKELRSNYRGKIFDYWDYDKQLRKEMKRR